ncbi:MAG: DUF1365 domain-containing protein [Candidatus Marinimicrobia bacterium]|nr:DUF1365 domain-containing protein [Candidatus Neomarinimicrobiota bacterium]
MNSKLYTGQVRHKRYKPFIHDFRYKLFMVYLDLSEVDTIVRDSWIYSARHKALVEFRRSDYFGDPKIDLDTSIRHRVAEETGKRPTGPIRMLTQLRLMGYVFNPVTFYYCFDQNDTQVETIVMEITNTPWKERHAYILPPELNLSSEPHRYQYVIDKDFHVSPFMSLDYQYDMRFGVPDEKLFITIKNQQPENKKKFVATLQMKQNEFTQFGLLTQLIKFPLVTFKVVWGIYWQALLLKLKGATFHPHPGGLKSTLNKEV